MIQIKKLDSGEGRIRTAVPLSIPHTRSPIFYDALTDPANTKTPVLINCGWASPPKLYHGLARAIGANGHDVYIMPMDGVANDSRVVSPSQHTLSSAFNSLELLANLGIREIILAPHSCGSQVALEMLSQLNDAGISVKGVLFNAPSAPETLSAFPKDGILHKISFSAAWLFLKLVSLCSLDDTVTRFSKFFAKLSVATFKLLSPLFVMKATKESKEALAEFWKFANTLSPSVLAVSEAAITRDGYFAINAMERITCPVMVVSYERDLLVSRDIGERLRVHLANASFFHSAMIPGETHFGHESNTQAFVSAVRPFFESLQS